MKNLLSKFTIFAFVIALGIAATSCNNASSDKQKVLDLLNDAIEEVQKANSPEEVSTIAEKYEKKLDAYTPAIEKMPQEDQEEIAMKAVELMGLCIKKSGLSLENLDFDEFQVD